MIRDVVDNGFRQVMMVDPRRWQVHHVSVTLCNRRGDKQKEHSRIDPRYIEYDEIVNDIMILEREYNKNNKHVTQILKRFLPTRFSKWKIVDVKYMECRVRYPTAEDKRINYDPERGQKKEKIERLLEGKPKWVQTILHFFFLGFD